MDLCNKLIFVLFFPLQSLYFFLLSLTLSLPPLWLAGMAMPSAHVNMHISLTQSLLGLCNYSF